LHGHHNSVSTRGTSWSFDGCNWHPLYMGTQAYVLGSAAFHISAEAQQAIADLIENRSEEPFSHDLYREAWQQRHNNPRSALVIAVAAAEIGIKEYIKGQLRDQNAYWLVDTIQIPPLKEIITEYLPRLVGKRQIPALEKLIPDIVFNDVLAAVRKRNTVVHSKSRRISYAELQPCLLAIRDLLWILDYYSGHDWALSYVRPEALPDDVPNVQGSMNWGS
jgi:hypothetical protein